jgi:hypothetical protein
LKIVNEHVGDLQVEGSVQLNPSVSILSHWMNVTRWISTL